MKTTFFGALAAGTMLAGMAHADTTVQLWSFLDPEGESHRSTTLAATIDGFEAANPGVTVETTVMQWSELGPALLRADMTGRTPDAVMIYSPLMPAQIEAGSIAPLQDRIGGLPDTVQEDLLLMSVAINGDEVFGVPWEARSFGIFYRRDLLEARGLEAPTTLDGLRDIAAQIAEEEDIFGIAASFDPSSSHAPLEWLMPTLLSTGAPILTADGDADFGGAGTVEVLTQVASWFDQSAAELDVMLDTNDNAQRLAESGRVVFLMQGTHRAGGLRNASEGGIEWGYMPFPGITTDQPVPATIQGWQVVIPTDAENPDAAFDLVTHWISEDVQLMQAEASGYMPVRPSLAANPVFDVPTNAHVRAGLAHAAAAPLNFTYPRDTDALNTALGGMLQQVITGSMSPEDAIAWAEDEYNRMRR